MSPAGFDPALSASERPQTARPLGPAHANLLTAINRIQRYHLGKLPPKFCRKLKNSLKKICSSHLSSLQLPARRQLHSNNLMALQKFTARCRVNKMVTLSLNSFHYHINIGLCKKCMNVQEVKGCEFSRIFNYFFRTFPDS